jgi:hypothetical protein
MQFVNATKLNRKSREPGAPVQHLMRLSFPSSVVGIGFPIAVARGEGSLPLASVPVPVSLPAVAFAQEPALPAGLGALAELGVPQEPALPAGLGVPGGLASPVEPGVPVVLASLQGPGVPVERGVPLELA